MNVRKTGFLVVALFAIVFAVSGCQNASEADAEEPHLDFSIDVSVDEDSEATMTFSVVNDGEVPFPEGTTVDGVMTLDNLDSGTTAVTVETPNLERLLPGDSAEFSWSGPLEPGSYVVEYGAPEYGSLFLGFEVEEGVIFGQSLSGNSAQD